MGLSQCIGLNHYRSYSHPVWVKTCAHFGFLRMSSSCPTTVEMFVRIILKAISSSLVISYLQHTTAAINSAAHIHHAMHEMGNGGLGDK